MKEVRIARRRKKLTHPIGSGRERRPWDIRRWLNNQGYTIKDLAGELGVTPSAVSHTIRGARNHRKVLELLRHLGCPTKYLALPEDMQDEAA
ncbi:helix-turn-helix domain-containing protein [Desulfohalovibrio reitneri]|uniref:helix-turn-helix domain-containing protein n=1 Tax=Desulfohalovibrio reitneri TaxID=1307759 RepID=UPI00068FD70D|nr:helix-turn-helix transcriptional regulator [Desulfohalovibrio reitneri]